MAEPQVQHQPADPVSEGRSAPRKLNLSKCSFCRRHKKRCTPQPRQWPQKCDRCMDKGFECSPNTRARRQETAARRNPLPSVADNSPIQEISPTIDNKRPSSSDNPDSHHFDNWTYADFSNAVSFLRITRRVIQNEQWEDAWEIYKGLHSPFRRIEALACMVETLQNGLLRYISSRTTVLTQAKNELAASEASRLHLLAYNILEISQAEYASETHSMTIHGHDDTIISSMIESMAANHEIGAALLLEEQCLIKKIKGSGDDHITAFTAFHNRCKMFHPALEKLSIYFQAVMHCNDCDYAKDVIGCFSRGYVIDSNAHWVLELVKQTPLWGLTDCLGSPILHGILGELGRESFSLTEEEKGYLYTNIGPYCAKHDLLDASKRSTLHIAARYNLSALVHAILESGVSPDVQDDEGQRPLHYAAASGYEEICKILVSFEAEVHCRDDATGTPLMYALSNGDNDIVRLLLGHGAGDSLETDEKGTVLTYALNYGSPDFCALVLDWYEKTFTPETLGALQCRRGQTLFHRAIAFENLEVVKDLAKRSVKGGWWRLVNLRDRWGRTALSKAVANGEGKKWEAIIEALLGIDGIDIEIPDEYDKTAMDYAKKKGNADVLRMLSEKRRLNSMRGENDISERTLSTIPSSTQEVPALPIPAGSQQLTQLLPPPYPTSMPARYSYMYSHQLPHGNNHPFLASGSFRSITTLTEPRSGAGSSTKSPDGYMNPESWTSAPATQADGEIKDASWWPPSGHPHAMFE